MRIAITGITGSLGSALLARLAVSGADRVVGFSRDEHKRLALASRYSWHPGVKIYAGDIRDASRLSDIFASCEFVIHAAARKVVSSQFDEPREMHLTNIIGTANVVQAARVAGVRKLLFVSSDKATHPCNVYGASKMMAEQLVIAENARTYAGGLRCSVIRYGNVLASNGSVVRVWREAASRGEPLPVSDRRMTRFWVTLEQAAEYVLRAVMDLRGGEIFVPHLKAASVIRLLEAIAPTAQTTEIGIRPGGEKLHEQMLNEEEVRRAKQRNGWYIVPPPDTSELWDTSPWLGESVSADFLYRSDVWPDQASADDLRAMIR